MRHEEELTGRIEAMRGALLKMHAANIRVTRVLNDIGSDPTMLEGIKKIRIKKWHFVICIEGYKRPQYTFG